MARLHVIILGAGRPEHGRRPPALISTAPGRRTLDWILDAVKGHDARITFVAGYGAQDIADAYPDIRFVLNTEWQDEGAAGSLARVPLQDDEDVLILYADVLVHGSVVNQLMESAGDIVLAGDGAWSDRHPDGLPEDSEVALVDGQRLLVAQPDASQDAPAHGTPLEFIGAARLAPKAIQAMHDLRGDSSLQGMLPPLWNRLAMDLDVRVIDVAGAWAELNDTRDIARFVLGTKAETLERLSPLVQRSVIGDVDAVTVAQWRTDAAAATRALESRSNQLMVVRSSARSEDGFDSSNAGAYTSLMGVSFDGLPEAIGTVIESYPDARPDDQVLIQEQVLDVDFAGVAFTRARDHGGPYFVINYDGSGRTDAVTSGDDGGRVAIVLRGSQLPDDLAHLAGVVDALEELVQLLHYDALDVEFAVKGNTVHVFQVRPLAVDVSHLDLDPALVGAQVDAFDRVFQRAPGPGVVAGDPLFSNMADWNPAEIIGTAPRRLALDLYRYLVTDHVWAQQRQEAGYRDLRGNPLLWSFGGRPYIDVRADFHSFIPAALSDDVAGRIATRALDMLRMHPELHDKVEFDVLLTCLSFDTERQMAERYGDALGEGDIADWIAALRGITMAAMERVEHDMTRIENAARLVVRGQGAVAARALLDRCRRDGTVPFAHLARAGFVAATHLRDLVATGVLKQADVDAYMASIETVAGRFEADSARVAAGSLDAETFHALYGHLRPGTYELTSPRYDADPATYLRPMPSPGRDLQDSPWSDATWAKVCEAYERLGLPSARPVIDGFLRGAIAGREAGKFEFTRMLSDALEHLAAEGASWGLAREDVSHLPLDAILRMADDPAPHASARLGQMSRDGRAAHQLTCALELPPVLLRPEDTQAFHLPHAHPNFVTHQSVTAPPTSAHVAEDIPGRIVMVPQADPGYDWIFAHEPAGLITMYGGANSHMAIRAAELRLPAAIGVGETLFDELSSAPMVALDCLGQRLRRVERGAA